jgi:hypothetical protein
MVIMAPVGVESRVICPYMVIMAPVGVESRVICPYMVIMAPVSGQRMRHVPPCETVMRPLTCPNEEINHQKGLVK